MRAIHVLVSCALVVVWPLIARGTVITFETDPAGATPTDDAFLSTAYNITDGGTAMLFFDNNANHAFDPLTDTRAVFEAYGPDANDAFSNNLLTAGDTANGGLSGQLGNFFLRQFQPGSPPPPFVIDYNTSQTITAFSGEIWDIDGAPGNTERWKVEVLDASNAVLTSQDSPLGDTAALDGLPWTFTFSGLPAGVDKIRITFTGSKTSGLGMAFNNFDPTNVPEPSATALALCGAATLLRRRTRVPRIVVSVEAQHRQTTHETHTTSRSGTDPCRFR